MTSFKVDLDLRNHCIATEIKKRYNVSLSNFLKSRPGYEPPEEEIELLKQALETLDFPGLRSLYPDLAGDSDSQVTLGIDENRLFLCINEKPVELLFRKQP
jgi:hypothetical protein